MPGFSPGLDVKNPFILFLIFPATGAGRILAVNFYLKKIS
jgi:hypothetical protein